MSAYLRSPRRRRGALLMGAAALLAATAIAAPASASVTAVSSTRDVDGFPSWYRDAAGFQVSLCVTDPNCLGGAQARPAEEAFYAVARAEVDLKSKQAGSSGGRARYRAVLEGAWASPDMLPGEQTTFVRTQVTVSKIDLVTYPSGSPLTFNTPYGPLSGKVTGDLSKGRFTGKMSRDRKESVLGTPDNGFNGPLSAAATMYGPNFLRWTDADRPAGYLGDPTVLHAVTGAVAPNRNAFSLDDPPPGLAVGTTLFEVAGVCVNPTC
jgi:hypothetical protein